MITLEEIDKLVKEFNFKKSVYSTTIDLTSRNIHNNNVFEFRKNENDVWDIHSHISGIQENGVFVYKLIWGNKDAYEYCRNAYIEFLKKLKAYRVQKKINKAQEDFK